MILMLGEQRHAGKSFCAGSIQRHVAGEACVGACQASCLPTALFEILELNLKKRKG